MSELLCSCCAELRGVGNHAASHASPRTGLEFVKVTEHIVTDQYTVSDLYKICPYIASSEYYALLLDMATNKPAVNQEAVEAMMDIVRKEYTAKHQAI